MTRLADLGAAHVLVTHGQPVIGDGAVALRMRSSEALGSARSGEHLSRVACARAPGPTQRRDHGGHAPWQVVAAGCPVGPQGMACSCADAVTRTRTVPPGCS